MKHPRYRNIVWDYDKQKWVFLESKKPKRYYCHARGCTYAADLYGKKPPYTPFRYCARCRKRLSRANNQLKSIYNDLKHSAARRKIHFDLHYGAFLLIAIEAGLAVNHDVDLTSMSVDRIKEELGYTKDNIQIISLGLNASKENRRRFKSKWQDILTDETEPTDDADPF